MKFPESISSQGKAEKEIMPKSPEIGIKELNNEQLKQYASFAQARVEQYAAEILSKSEKIIDSSAQGMKISPEMLNVAKKERGLDDQLQEIQNETHHAVEELKNYLETLMELTQPTIKAETGVKIEKEQVVSKKDDDLEYMEGWGTINEIDAEDDIKDIVRYKKREEEAKEIEDMKEHERLIEKMSKKEKSMKEEIEDIKRKDLEYKTRRGDKTQLFEGVERDMYGVSRQEREQMDYLMEKLDELRNRNTDIYPGQKDYEKMKEAEKELAGKIENKIKDLNFEFMAGVKVLYGGEEFILQGYDNQSGKAILVEKKEDLGKRSRIKRSEWDASGKPLPKRGENMQGFYGRVVTGFDDETGDIILQRGIAVGKDMLRPTRLPEHKSLNL